MRDSYDVTKAQEGFGCVAIFRKHCPRCCPLLTQVSCDAAYHGSSHQPSFPLPSPASSAHLFCPAYLQPWLRTSPPPSVLWFLAPHWPNVVFSHAPCLPQLCPYLDLLAFYHLNGPRAAFPTKTELYSISSKNALIIGRVFGRADDAGCHACIRHRSTWLQLPPLIQAAANGHPGKQQVVVQVAEFLPPTWETWKEFQGPRFILAQLQLFQTFRE